MASYGYNIGRLLQKVR